MRSAIDYASLIGKYVDMARQTTEAERRESGLKTGTYAIGGVVIRVSDVSKPGGIVPTMRGVRILFDYGYGADIWFDQEEQWTIDISEEGENDR